MRGDGGRVMTAPPSRPEARSRFGFETANELGARSLLPCPNSCLGASPHQQGRDTKMLSFCGIDVSKDRLDVVELPDDQCCSVPNDAAGWAALVEWLRNL